MINYKLIDRSITYYEAHGFKRIESPWTVSKAIDDLTRPEGVIPYQLKHNDKCLVASGEQSFLYMNLKEFLPKGKFQTVTPCFRNEPFDELHSKYFIKNELIQTDIVNKFYLDEMVESALEFFHIFFNKNDIKVVEIDDSFDIVAGDYELGSYGIRSNFFLDYIYGTGCAEPRLSRLIRNFGIKQ